MPEKFQLLTSYAVSPPHVMLQNVNKGVDVNRRPNSVQMDAEGSRRPLLPKRNSSAYHQQGELNASK